MWGDASSKYNMSASPATPANQGDLAKLPTPTAGGDPDKLLGLANPLTAFLVIGVIWAGMAAFSTTVRVGNVSAGLKVGDS